MPTIDSRNASPSHAARPLANPDALPTREELLAAYRAVRSLSTELVEPLEPEDFRMQPIEDVSPPWWNLGHTSWFFARNILHHHGLYPPSFERLEWPLNSYYEGLGPRVGRARRGSLSRPTTAEILDYRQAVDERLEGLIDSVSEADYPRLVDNVVIGLQHEQQHQELLVTEIQYILWANPSGLREAYREAQPELREGAPDHRFIGFAEGLTEIGHHGDGWTWDNERPRHRRFLEPFELGSRLVTNREYLAFIDDGGYEDPLLWMSNGWAAVQDQGWEAPLYWERSDDDAWKIWTLGGLVDLDPSEPVAHVGFYEADAFARWLSLQGDAWQGTRLPTEFEWEHAARMSGFETEGANFLDTRRVHPRRARADLSGLQQLAGDLWEWTSSHYEPYPGFRPFEGDLAEYNGKFMDNQRVLRGGSCATPADHIRLTYRNFWPAGTRFQMTGIRLARG